MNANSNPSAEKSSRRMRGGIVAGGILILIGAISLLSRVTTFNAMLYPLGLGLIFLAWGLLTRTSGLLIPGGVLTGIFAGSALMEIPMTGTSDPARGGVFLAVFAASWVLISLLSIYTESPRKGWTWPLFPAVALGLVAAALLAGETGMKALEYAGYGWPVVLIGVGIYLILKRNLKEALPSPCPLPAGKGSGTILNANLGRLAAPNWH